MKKFAACVISLMLVQAAFSQKRAADIDLNGTWRLVESRNIRRRTPGTFEKTLVITHRGPELRMAIELNENGRQRNLEQVYFSDGRGEMNSTFTENERIDTRTKWRDNKLEILSVESTTVRSPTGQTRSVRIEIRERWELSKDRNKLTKTTIVSSSAARMINEMSGDSTPSVEVFARVD